LCEHAPPHFVPGTVADTARAHRSSFSVGTTYLQGTG